ncbi:tRNA pseudouridine(55) synthase TruB [Altericroceibacterium spongiae]|uniref:tRNA pseudouridine synthase B n=1 Tax=Altericroceibacterium spongiae TaxID=2320269 RepID=A0A420EQT6_9SPHN|nr:tRNA pseudouridine(55) synthase TruB [Altericroceibacterium spongiae]RKF23056.1 tRNA pseudouridine(55) synthase TruB [Altericroceibacterium spongiae]
MAQPHGWIILDKPAGLGSTQAVAAVKRNLREAGYGKKYKVGHGGTLDPLAEGILPIAIGEATKLCGRMLDASKIYAFTVQFGVQTDTLDAEGEVVERSDFCPALAQVEAVLPEFTGPIEQMPPAFSALKVAGKRAYDLARAGEEVKLEPRQVTIHSLTVLAPKEGQSGAEQGHKAAERGQNPSAQGLSEVTLVANVSKGTYIRSLARDIALAVGSVGHVTMLRRLKSGPFTESQAISLDKLNEIGKGAPFEDIILPLEAGLDDIPALDLDPEAAVAVRQGRVLTGCPEPDGLYWARAGTVPVALMELDAGTAKVVRGFNLQNVAE